MQSALDRHAADLSTARAKFETKPSTDGAYQRLLETENRYLRCENAVLRQENKKLNHLFKRRK